MHLFFRPGLDYEISTKSDLLLVLHLGVGASYLGDLFIENSSLGMAFEETSLASNKREGGTLKGAIQVHLMLAISSIRF
jgi:hypothetical protein